MSKTSPSYGTFVRGANRPLETVMTPLHAAALAALMVWRQKDGSRDAPYNWTEYRAALLNLRDQADHLIKEGKTT